MSVARSLSLPLDRVKAEAPEILQAHGNEESKTHRRPESSSQCDNGRNVQQSEEMDIEGAGIEECQLGSKKRRVAVTGAGGFIASWIVKLLLQRGFYVRGALRSLDDESTSHLKRLEGASERLELMKANILHLPSLVPVVQDCEGVFHTACPVLPTVSDPEAQMLRPAVEGTLNVLRACDEAHVKRVVMTSSIGAVYMNPNTSPEQVINESCWSDENYLKDIQEWYCLAKVMAEKTAWDYSMSRDVDLVTICPGITLGKMLQPRINQSSTHILKYLNGSAKTYKNLCQAYVDVEDVALAHVLALVTPTARGRYLCCKWSRHRGEVVNALTHMFPHYPIPTRCKEEGEPKKAPLRFCNQKVEQHLGLQFTALEQTLRQAVRSLQAKGVLPNPNPSIILNLDDRTQNTSNATPNVVLFPTVAHPTKVGCSKTSQDQKPHTRGIQTGGERRLLSQLAGSACQLVPPLTDQKILSLVKEGKAICHLNSHLLQVHSATQSLLEEVEQPTVGGKGLALGLWPFHHMVWHDKDFGGAHCACVFSPTDQV